ncbi:AsnC family transcriptional regulator [Clostridium hydrogenum]|nr:AsnC family protein [Clostridium hydrogenum]
MQMKIDNTDIKILKELQEDSRLSIRELGKGDKYVFVSLL